MRTDNIEVHLLSLISIIRLVLYKLLPNTTRSVRHIPSHIMTVYWRCRGGRRDCICCPRSRQQCWYSRATMRPHIFASIPKIMPLYQQLEDCDHYEQGSTYFLTSTIIQDTMVKSPWTIEFLADNSETSWWTNKDHEKIQYHLLPHSRIGEVHGGEAWVGYPVIRNNRAQGIRKQYDTCYCHCWVTEKKRIEIWYMKPSITGIKYRGED